MKHKSVTVHTPASYEDKLSQIEDFYFGSTENLTAVQWFINEHQAAIEFITKNPQTPPISPKTGDHSWGFANGNCRLFIIQ